MTLRNRIIYIVHGRSESADDYYWAFSYEPTEEDLNRIISKEGLEEEGIYFSVAEVLINP